MRYLRALLFLVTSMAGAMATPAVCAAVDDGSLSFDNAEVRLGDRLFFETRFAQFYFAQAKGDSNATLPAGDPLMDKVPVALGEDLPGPFAGQGINCRQCHLGSDFLPDRLRAGRTYGDFTRRSPIPPRGDGQVVTSRNSPLMIDLGIPREVPELFHFDGEFVSHEDVIRDTLVGRNMGWLPNEQEIAKKHIAKIIREDEGMNPRHIRYADGKGIPYRVVLAGESPTLLHQEIPAQYRIDVMNASDDEILDAIAVLMHAYMDSLRFGTNNTFRKSASPYDLFLKKNDLPAAPNPGEPAADYADRLLKELNSRIGFAWVDDRDDRFALHEQSFQFGPTEFIGLRTFLTRAGDAKKKQGVGNCVACHPPPRFTDFSLHNTGVSQIEYDAIFQDGAFAALKVPGLSERNANFDAYLPPSAKHPNASGRFRSIPEREKPGRTDLGVWNVFANPDLPKPQAALRTILCAPSGPAPGDCREEEVLPLTLGYFKTPSIRDLGQSEPYFHTGGVDTVDEALAFYRTVSDLARAGKLRNGSPEIAQVQLGDRDQVALVAFLRSLNEDYH